MGKVEVHTGFWWGNLRETYHLEDPDIDGRVIFTLIFRKWEGGKEWIDLAQNNDRWHALVNAVVNLWVP